MRSWWHDDSDDADLRAACDVIRGAHEGPFDGIIGFSQGGALAALLAASRAGGRGASLPSLAMLKFLIVAGAYAVPGFPRVALDEGLQTLHIMSVQDTCVNCSASQDLARRFPGSTTHMHEQGHCLPVRAADLDVYQAFVAQTHSPTASVNEATEEQQEELEAMKAIFMDDILECRLAPPSIKVAIRDSGAGADAAISMTLPAGYPESARELPAVKCLGMPRDLAAACQAALLEEMKANAGSPMLFQLVNYVREWLQENPTGGDAQAALGCGGSGGAGCEAEQPDDASISALLARGVDEEEALGAGAVEDMVDAATDEAARWEAAHQPAVGLSGAAESKEIARGEGGGGGLWKFTVGLVGKPSAGKSTLFNALVCPQKEDEEAKVGAFPFTTIDPNLGQGFHTVPTPEGARDIADVAAPRWGVAGNQERMVPVHILDVAGLVPGAYQGRGHGNSFLNDLCGADCLIHVVDASGSTDAGGNPLDADPGVPDPPPPTHARRGGERQAGDAGVGGGESVAGGPVGDVRWVRQEVHRWIYNNIKAKWPSVVRLGAERLVELLTGYQQSRALSLHSLARAGVELKAEAPVDFARFTPRELHRVVAHFVRVRFPMVLACNKMDHPRAPDNVRALRAAYPNEVFVPIAALYELALVRLRRDGHISYASGDAAGGIRLAPGAPGAAAAKLEAAQVAESSLLCGVLVRNARFVVAALREGRKIVVCAWRHELTRDRSGCRVAPWACRQRWRSSAVAQEYWKLSTGLFLCGSPSTCFP